MENLALVFLGVLALATPLGLLFAGAVGGPLSRRAGFAPGPELAQSILAFARSRLASYKRIRIVEFGELPKTLSGKIRRVELRQRENARKPGEAWTMEFREAE